MASRNVFPKVHCSVLDGSAVLWPANGTVRDFVVNFKQYIQHKLNSSDVYLVFDRYQDVSTKSTTRCNRITWASRVHRLALGLFPHIKLSLQCQKINHSWWEVSVKSWSVTVCVCDEYTLSMRRLLYLWNEHSTNFIERLDTYDYVNDILTMF